MLNALWNEEAGRAGREVAFLRGCIGSRYMDMTEYYDGRYFMSMQALHCYVVALIMYGGGFEQSVQLDMASNKLTAAWAAGLNIV